LHIHKDLLQKINIFDFGNGQKALVESTLKDLNFVIFEITISYLFRIKSFSLIAFLISVSTQICLAQKNFTEFNLITVSSDIPTANIDNYEWIINPGQILFKENPE
jgi:hypothetical protein